MEQNYLEILDNIILSDNVVENFYSSYNTNSEFRKWIDSNIPEIKKCEEQKQNNPWHVYNILGHILHSVEEMNKMSKGLNSHDRKILAYTMLFHDIGKPDTHIVREKNGQMIDSFFGHNEKSFEISKETLPKLGFNESDVKIISKLVYKHDIFMFIKLNKTSNRYWRVLTNDLIRKEIKDLNEVGDGKKLMKYLIMVGRSDNLAQNSMMTGESLRMLDRFDQMLNELD